MKYLRQYIRRLILESEQHENLWHSLFNPNKGGYTEETFPSMSDELNVYHQAAAKKAARENEFLNSGPEQIEANFKLRRDVKKFWNENADHDFWNNKVTAVHSLSYYGSLHLQQSEFAENTDLTLRAFFEKYPRSIRQKDEMSTYGVGPNESMLEFMRNNNIHMGVILKGYVTWASANDSFTESRSLASTEDLIRHAQSGLPKRPALEYNFDPDAVLFDEEDLKSHWKSSIGELVIDNWTYDTVIASKEETTTSERIRIRKLCKKYGVKLKVI